MTLDQVMDEVRAAMSRNGKRCDIDTITHDTAMSQDAGIDGIDVYDFAADLGQTFGQVVWEIPWGRFSDQRASFYGCIAALYAPVWLFWRLISWPFHGEFVPRPNGGNERLTLMHLAEVLHQGRWLEPGDRP